MDATTTAVKSSLQRDVLFVGTFCAAVASAAKQTTTANDANNNNNNDDDVRILCIDTSGNAVVFTANGQTNKTRATHA